MIFLSSSTLRNHQIWQNFWQKMKKYPKYLGFEYQFCKQILLFFPAISNQYRVDGLMPKTFYHFRARARNEAGYSDYSNMIYLQTSASHAVGELLGSASTSKSVISLAQPFIVLCSILSTTTILVVPVEYWQWWIICAQQL